MDWARAKTILIAVFLTINIFLLYMIFGTDIGNIGYVDNEKVQQITKYLAEKDILVKGQVPAKKVNMPAVTVKYKLFEKDAVAKVIFSPEEKTTETIQGSIIKLKGERIEISIKDSRELSYTNSSISPAAVIDEKTCKMRIEEFLTRLDLKDKAKLTRVEGKDGYKRFTYSQTFKGAAIYNSIMELYVNNAGVYTARIVWFEAVKQVGKKAPVISPAIALLSVPQYYKDSKAAAKEVLDVQQGYYFGTGTSGQVDVSMVEEGTAFPAWRVITDRDIIYINAYNEKVEGVEKARK